MVFGTYRDLFTVVAASAASLTGLLFVAISVAPRPAGGTRRDVIQQVRAAASLLAFTNVLVVSLFGLVPRNNVGYPAIAMGIIGVLFTAAGLRSIAADPAGRRRIRGQLGLVGLLLVTFSVELVAGFILLSQERDISALDVLSNVLVASLLIGVARAWELVGDRDTGVISSIAALAGHERPLGVLRTLSRPDGPAEEPAGRPAGPGDRPDQPGRPDGSAGGPGGGPAGPGDPPDGSAGGPGGGLAGPGDRPDRPDGADGADGADAAGERGSQDGSPPPAG